MTAKIITPDSESLLVELRDNLGLKDSEIIERALELYYLAVRQRHLGNYLKLHDGSHKVPSYRVDFR